jgi:hypothetical protein
LIFIIFSYFYEIKNKECGSNFTAKLEGMFQDVDLSRECSAAFRLYQISKSKDGLISTDLNAVEMHIQVLTTGFWPSTNSGSKSFKSQSSCSENSNGVIGENSSLIIPVELQALMGSFQSFYVQKYQGRRLAWAHALERCVVSARFPKGKKDLVVSLFQVIFRCILLIISLNKFRFQ